MLGFLKSVLMITVGCVVVMGSTFFVLTQKSEPSHDTAIAQVASSSQSCSRTLIMYSQKGCSVCHAMKKQLQQAGIPFDSYDIDINPQLQREVGKKAMKAGWRTIHIPIFEANGKLFHGTTDMNTLRQSLC